MLRDPQGVGSQPTPLVPRALPLRPVLVPAARFGLDRSPVRVLDLASYRSLRVVKRPLVKIYFVLCNSVIFTKIFRENLNLSRIKKLDSCNCAHSANQVRNPIWSDRDYPRHLHLSTI